MIKTLLATTAALSLMAFNNGETCETIVVTSKGNKEPHRINLSDYEADQAKPDDERQYTKAGKVQQEKNPESQAAGTVVPWPENVPVTAAPSAPNFSGNASGDPGAQTTTLPMDETKQAVAPAAPSVNQRFVAKESVGTGKNKTDRFFVVNERGERFVDGAVNDKDGYATEKAAWDAILGLPR